MTDLTEKWKKRTLPNGVYYIKLIGGDILPAFCNTEYILKQFQTMKGIYDGADIKVLALVPSYEEYLALQSESLVKNEFDNEIDELNDTIDKLKKLLKECRKWIGVERNFAVPNEKVILQQLLTEIDEVLE